MNNTNKTDSARRTYSSWEVGNPAYGFVALMGGAANRGNRFNFGGHQYAEGISAAPNTFVAFLLGGSVS